MGKQRCKLVFSQDDRKSTEKNQSESGALSRESSLTLPDSIMIKTKSGRFLDRKKTFEKSAPQTERNSVNNEAGSIAPGKYQLFKNRKISDIFYQKSGSDQASVLADASKNIFKPRRVSNTLKEALSKISNKEKPTLSTPMSPQKYSPSPIQKSAESNQLKLNKFNLTVLNKTSSQKGNIFQLPLNDKDKNISPFPTDRNRSNSIVQKSPSNTYYLKLQNRNAINAKAAGNKFIRKENSSDNPEKSRGHPPLKRQNSQGVIESTIPANKESFTGKTPEQSIGYKPGNHLSEAFSETFRERKQVMPKAPNKASLHSFTKFINREDSPNNRGESNYLLPVNNTQQAFKKARGRPLKNSLLRNVFNNQPQ